MAMPQTQLHIEAADVADGPAAVLRVSGELDLATADQLRQAVGQYADSPRPLIIDLAGVTFCDSTGFGVLINAYRRVTSAGGRLLLCGLQPRLTGLLEVTGIDRVIPVHPSLVEALADAER